MNCTTCDMSLEPGTMFCPNCGTRVIAPASVGTPTIAIAPPEDQLIDAPQPYAPQPYAPQPYTPQQPYAPQQFVMNVSPPTSGAATVSLVFGILAWVMLPLIGALIAVVAGHMARNQIRASNNQIGGAGLATAGLVLGYVQLGLSLLGCLALALLVGLGVAFGN